MFHSPREHAWLNGAQPRIAHCGVSEKSLSSQRHVSYVAALVTEHLYTISLTYLTYLPTIFSLTVLSIGITAPSPTGYEPKVLQSDEREVFFTWCDALHFCKQAKLLWTVVEISLNSTSLLELRKSYLILRNLAHTFPHGLVIWNVLQRKAWNDIANWRTKQLNNFLKSQVHALTTTNSRIKKWDLLEIGQRFAHKLLKKKTIFGAHWKA